MHENWKLDPRTEKLIVSTKLSATVLRSLGPVSTALGFLYTVFAARHLLLLPAGIRWTMAILAAATAVAFVFVARQVYRRTVPTGYAHWIAAGIGFLVYMNTAVHLWLGRDALQITSLMLLLMGAGFLLLSTSWFTALSVLIAATSAIGIATLAQPTAQLHYAVALLATTLVAVLVHRERRHTIQRLERLRLQREHQRVELQATLQKLERSEENYRNLAENAGDLVQSVRPDGTFHYVNRAWLATLGYTMEEVRQLSAFDVIHPDHHGQCRAIFEQLTEEPCTRHIEATFLAKDGREVLVEGKVSCSFERGQAQVTRGIFRDVTARREAQREVAERRSYLEGVLAAAPDAIVTLDERHNILEWNVGAERLFGYRQEEVVGHYIDPLITNSEAREEAIALTQRAMQGLEILPIETVRYRKDGSAVNVILAASPIWIEDELAGAAAVYTDITALKRAETDLRRRNADLDAFSHTVAHDLKGPLSNIYGYASVLEQELPPGAGQILSDGISVIARSAQRMGSIIDALLLLAGLRGAEVEVATVDMGSVVGDVLQRLAYMVTKYDAQVVQPEHWPEAVGYSPWIEEVWANYISNALKYGGKPPVVELGAETLPEGVIRYWVRDNGAGLTEEQQTQLFAPFTRLSQVRVEGHGLGLSIVHRIIDRLGGRVGVSSAPDQGSEFYFCLPVPSGEATSL